MVSDYEVGWGKPPVGNRFKKGQSGNPQGRSRGTRNLQTDLTEELGEKIVVQQGEQTIRISKQRALVKTKSWSKPADDDAATVAPTLSAEESEMWQGLLKEVRAEQAAPSNLGDKADEDGDES